jgi:hypothetical protein
MMEETAQSRIMQGGSHVSRRRHTRVPPDTTGESYSFSP